MNTITFELCAEDRARLDRIIGALENHQNCEHCVSAAITMTKAAQVEAETPTVKANEPTPTTNTPPAEKPEETPTEHPLDAPPIEVNEPTAPEAPTVTRKDVRGKVVKLCAAGKKEDVKKVVTAYAEAVKDIPEDKLAEVFEKLTALEG
jgi:hypothetical protein